MMAEISSTKPNIDLAKKEFLQLTSIAAATAPAAMGNMTGWTLTVPVTGKFRVTTQCALNMVPTIASTECGSYWQLAKDGVAVPGTWRAYLERTVSATTPTFYDSLDISITLDLVAGEVITLQGDRHNSDTVVMFTNGSLFEMEQVFAYVPVIDSNKLYTTSETDTGKTWIDGKKIYRKVIDFGLLPNTTAKDVAHGITTLDKVVQFYGTADNGTYQLPIPHLNTIGLNISYSCYIDQTNVRITTGGATHIAYYAYVTIEYTKA